MSSPTANPSSAAAPERSELQRIFDVQRAAHRQIREEAQKAAKNYGSSPK